MRMLINLCLILVDVIQRDNDITNVLFMCGMTQTLY